MQKGGCDQIEKEATAILYIFTLSKKVYDFDL